MFQGPLRRGPPWGACLHQGNICFKNKFKKSYPLVGSQRRRLIPALSLDTPSPVRKPANSTGVRWVDGPLRSAQRGLGEPFEIKVYEIDDVERLQRRRGGNSKVSHLRPTRWRSRLQVLGAGMGAVPGRRA